MSGLLERLRRKSELQVEKYGAQYGAFTVFAMVFYVANPFKWHFVGPYPASVLAALRVMSLVLIIFLLLRKYWPTRCQKYLPLFWHFTLFYYLPFRTTFNVLYSPYTPSYESFGLLGILALAVLVDNKTFLVLTGLGVFFGTAVFFAGGGYLVDIGNPTKFIYSGIMVLSIAFIKFVFFRNHSIRQEERTRAFEILAGAIAHEVKTPLSAIMLDSSTLARENPEDPRVLRINRVSKKALRIVDTVLDQVKLIRADTPIDIKANNLRDCIDSAIGDDIFPKQEQARIRISCDDNIEFLGDTRMLSQTMSNLLRNAICSIAGKEEGRIEIAAKNYQSTILIDIEDNGLGIAPDALPHIFEAFYSKTKGTGLGLAFCKLAVERMGGSIHAQSVKGKFARFSITVKKPCSTREVIHNEIPNRLPLPHHDGVSR